MSYKALVISLALSLGLVPGAVAAEVEARYQTSALSFSGGVTFSNAVLKVTGPDDFEAEETASKGLPTFRVRGGRMKDGFYQFTLTAATDEKVKIKRPIDNGRGANARDYTLKPFSMSGMFEVSRGTILPVKGAADDGPDGDATE